jgi:hypothetical protein
MKKISLLLFSLLILSFTIFAQKDNTERKSPPATANGEIGSAMITVNYSSPLVKGREIFGDLVPYGKIWRAGANEATTFETTEELSINGPPLPAGKYSLFVIPKAEGSWTVIFNTEHSQWGAYKYNQDLDALRTEALIVNIDPIENLTYSIENNQLLLEWSTKQMIVLFDE